MDGDQSAAGTARLWPFGLKAFEGAQSNSVSGCVAAGAGMGAGRLTWDALVGRAAERELVASFLQPGGGPTLMLAGQAGVGKTAVGDAAAAGAHDEGYLVLSAYGAPFESNIAFAGLNQLLWPLANEASMFSADWADPLAAALGQEPARSWSAETIAAATIRCIDHLRGRAPAFITFDDLHWVDRPTVNVLAAMTERLTPASLIRLLMTFRSDRRPARFLPVPPITLAPLDDGAATVLLDRVYPRLGSCARARILVEAAGYPLGLVEFPAMLSEAQRRDAAALPYLLPPGPQVRGAFAVSGTGLSQPARRLLLLAALDVRARLSDLARALHVLPDVLRRRDDLAEVLASGLASIEGGSTASRLVFVHPLERSAFASSATADERRTAHASLAHAYEHELGPLARHLAEATDAPNDAVADRLEALSTRLLADGDATDALDALISSGRLSSDPPTRRRRLAGAAYLAVDVMGNLERAAALLDDIRNDGDGGSLATIVAAAKALLVGNADLTAAHHLLVVSLSERPTDQPGLLSDDRLAALFSLVRVCFFSSRPEMWPALRAAAAELGAAAPVDLQLMISVMADPARATDDALSDLDRALIMHADDRDPATIERIGMAALFVDRAHACHHALWRVVEDGRTGGAVTSSVHSAAVLWADAYHAGNWDTCAAVVEECLQLCERQGLYLPATLLHYGAGLLAASRGDHAQARQEAEYLDQWAGPRGMRTLQRFGWHVRGLSACGQGDFAAAHRWFRQLSPGGALPENAPESLWTIFELVEAAVRAGDRRYAVTYVQALDASTVERISPRLALACAGSRALVAEPDDAGDRYEIALSLPGVNDWPFDAARVQLAYGEHLRRRRALGEARHHLGAAQSVFQSLGAAPWFERAAAELRATGSPDQSGSTSTRPPRGLTPQEFQIASLVASGLTNKQIAERLQLSPRTVAAHLRQVFAKFDIPTRAAVHDVLVNDSREPEPP